MWDHYFNIGDNSADVILQVEFFMLRSWCDVSALWNNVKHSRACKNNLLPEKCHNPLSNDFFLPSTPNFFFLQQLIVANVHLSTSTYSFILLYGVLIKI